MSTEQEIQGQNNRLDLSIRYQRDPQFMALVDLLESFISQYDFTPTELREAVMLAAIRHEQRTVRPIFLPGGDRTAGARGTR